MAERQQRKEEMNLEARTKKGQDWKKLREELLAPKVRKALGEFLREERIRQGVSVRQLARVCGVSYQLVWLAEEGTIVSLERLINLLGALGCEVEIRVRRADGMELKLL